jgi:hypothetical protein
MSAKNIRQKLVYLPVLAVILLLAAHCGGGDGEPVELPGTYHGEYEVGDSDTLVLHSDGSFDETYQYHDGTESTNSGTWRAQVSKGNQQVILDHAILFLIGLPPLTPMRWELSVSGSGPRVTLKWPNPELTIELHKQN